MNTSNVRVMNKALIAKSAGAVIAAGLLAFAATAYHAPAPVAPVSAVQPANVLVAKPVYTEVAATPAPVVAPAPAAPVAAPDPAPGWADGQAPAGTPIPMHLDTDPNSGSYNQMVIMNPDQFCASNGGTTAPDGTAVCY